jgi:hypothetical protein
MGSRRIRALTMAVSASLLAAAGIAATATTASADSTLNVSYAVTGTAYISKLGTTVNLGAGTLASTVDLTTNTSTSTLTMPPATVSAKELGFIPVTATTVINQLGPATGTVNLSTNTITSTSTVDMQITSLSVGGLTIPVGNSCETSPFTIDLASGPGFTVGGGGPVSGTFTIPQFRHCGLTNIALDLSISGSGNSLDLTLGPLQLG